LRQDSLWCWGCVMVNAEQGIIDDKALLACVELVGEGVVLMRSMLMVMTKDERPLWSILSCPVVVLDEVDGQEVVFGQKHKTFQRTPCILQFIQLSSNSR